MEGRKVKQFQASSQRDLCQGGPWSLRGHAKRSPANQVC
jgi:hypothetical protein